MFEEAVKLGWPKWRWAVWWVVVVDPRLHAGELRSFGAKVVRGPQPNDCAVSRSALGADGYGRFWVYPGGVLTRCSPTAMRWPRP